MRATHKKNSKLKTVVVQHIKDNIKAYFFTACILLIGVTLGVLFINNLQETQSQEIQTYIEEFISELKKRF